MENSGWDWLLIAENTHSPVCLLASIVSANFSSGKGERIVILIEKGSPYFKHPSTWLLLFLISTADIAIDSLLSCLKNPL
ncbi:hypothetical protein RZS08_04990, partial [Arthrospira platensis SPKY1]|nr:hypothetical protein [Arthrospira platensis SPKY1]